MRGVIVLHKADATPVNSDMTDAPVVEMDDRVFSRCWMGPVVGEAFRIGFVIGIRPSSHKQHYLARLEVAVYLLPIVRDNLVITGLSRRCVVTPAG